MNDPVSDYWDDPARDTVHGPKSYRHREPVRRAKYRTIVADPPWPYPEGFALGPGHGVLVQRPLPYPCMSIEQIAALPVEDIADRHARLFLWATNRYLRDAFEVMAAWRFEYRQTLVWHKAGMNLPAHIAPNAAEFLLVGVKGSPDRLNTLPDAVYKVARRGGHSAKPDVFLDLVEQVSPGPYLELFARRRRLGWDAWGNEWYPDIKLDPADLAAYEAVCEHLDWRQDMERGHDRELYRAIRRKRV